MVRLVLLTLNDQVTDRWGIGMISHPVRLGVYLSVFRLSSWQLQNKQSANRENVITLSPIANVITFLSDLISASDTPFCHGASADEKIHLRPFKLLK